MNKEIKKQWVAALRSGEYIQTQGSLRDRVGFCCLGVLCDIFAKDHGMASNWEPMELSMKDEAIPSDEVRMWAGLSTADPAVNIGGKITVLSCHNDGIEVPMRTFVEIASAIEDKL